MNRYTLKEFLKVVESADIIYGTCSLNAAMTIQSRIRKKSLLSQSYVVSRFKDEIVEAINAP